MLLIRSRIITESERLLLAIRSLGAMGEITQIKLSQLTHNVKLLIGYQLCWEVYTLFPGDNIRWAILCF
jgi:hypothetical protein